jgi:hypothetical protein
VHFYACYGSDFLYFLRVSFIGRAHAPPKNRLLAGSRFICAKNPGYSTPFFKAFAMRARTPFQAAE